MRVPYLYYTAEAHESHSQKAGSQQGNRRTFHCFGHFRQRELLANAGEQNECKTEAQCRGKSEQRAGQHTVLCTHRQLLWTPSAW